MHLTHPVMVSQTDLYNIKLGPHRSKHLRQKLQNFCLGNIILSKRDILLTFVVLTCSCTEWSVDWYVATKNFVVSNAMTDFAVFYFEWTFVEYNLPNTKFQFVFNWSIT